MVRRLAIQAKAHYLHIRKRRERMQPGLDAEKVRLPVTWGLEAWRTQMPRSNIECFEAAVGASSIGVSSLLALSLDCMITYPGWAYLRGVVEEDSIYQCEGRGREDHVLREHWRWTRPGRLPDPPRRPRLSRAGGEESGRAGW